MRGDNQTAPDSGSGRIAVLDCARGIAIALVVWGHMVARDARPLGNDWWLGWNNRLYSFHMAFFFFLSGYVFFMKPSEEWGRRTTKTAGKLLPAYFLFAVVVYLGKAVAVAVMRVDRPVAGIIDEFQLMILRPTEGFAQFLWFIPVLLMIQALVSLAGATLTGHLGWVLCGSFLLHLASLNGDVTELFAMHQVARYALFFLLAAVCHQHSATWRALTSQRWGISVTLAFVAVLVLLPPRWLPTVAALLSLPALVYVAAALQNWLPARSLTAYLGRNSLTIYLMNSLAMGVARGLILRLWSWDDWRFLVVVPILFLSGLFIPIAAQHFIFSRWSWTDRITR